MRALRLLSICTLVTALLIQTASAQTSTADNSKPAANTWMLTPTPYLEWNRNISPALRAKRDGFWDEVTHREWPLTMEREAVGFGGPDWFDDGTELEIPEVPDRVVLTATFSSHRSVLSASEKSIYTEITMRVEEVFEDKTGAGRLVPQGNITVMLNGGAVTLLSGRVLADNTSPRSPFLQPGHSYLLVLEYHADGDWYGSREDWDISDGVVRANTLRTQYLARHGRSHLSGLPMAQLGTVLSKELYAGK